MTRALCLLLLAGCFDTQPPCQQNVRGAGIADIELRNPNTGLCESLGPTCDPACGLCPGLGDAAPDWGYCSGACEALSESQCLATASCHAAYQDNSGPAPTFWGCWEMPPSGVVHGSCDNLDAQSCSEHDDCLSVYTGPVNQPPNFVPSFERCVAEVAAPVCSTLTTEAACLARSDCDAIYNGMNCTCDKTGCTCQTQTYLRCQ